MSSSNKSVSKSYVNAVISSTPNNKRKKMESSFSPIFADNGLKSHDDMLLEYTPPYSLERVEGRHRNDKIVGKARKHIARTGRSKISTATQVSDLEEEALIEKYISEARKERNARMKADILAQQFREENTVVLDSLCHIRDCVNFALARVHSKEQVLELTKSESLLVNPSDPKVFHDKINRDLRTKSEISQIIKKTLYQIENEIRQTDKSVSDSRQWHAPKILHPWSQFTNSRKIGDPAPFKKSNSSSKIQNPICTPSVKISKRLPVNQGSTYLKSKKSVRFTQPLDDYLNTPTSSSSRPKVLESNPEPNIEIEIPAHMRRSPEIPELTEINLSHLNSQELDVIIKRVEKFRNLPQNKVDFSLLNVSTCSEEIVRANQKISEDCDKSSKILEEDIEKLTQELDKISSSQDDEEKIDLSLYNFEE